MAICTAAWRHSRSIWQRGARRNLPEKDNCEWQRSDMHPDFPVMTTPRLLLREILPSDVDALHAIHSDAHTMRWYGVDPVVTQADANVRLCPARLRF